MKPRVARAAVPAIEFANANNPNRPQVPASGGNRANGAIGLNRGHGGPRHYNSGSKEN
jgi:hypothetical protein